MPWLQLEDDNLDLIAKPEKKPVEVASAVAPTLTVVGDEIIRGVPC